MSLSWRSRKEEHRRLKVDVGGTCRQHRHGDAGERTARAARGFRFRDAGPIELKGKAERVPLPDRHVSAHWDYYNHLLEGDARLVGLLVVQRDLAQLALVHLGGVLARHRTSGEWAGLSMLCVDEFAPTVAFQEDTSVVRAHRGHRLGLLMKADMLRWISQERPEVTAADTWNATNNHHMIAVNERLGATVIAHNQTYRLRD